MTLKSVVPSRARPVPDCTFRWVTSMNAPFTENHGTLQHVPQLSHVARPFILEQCASRIARQADKRPAEANWISRPGGVRVR